jgi:hypothetical protein
MGDVSTAHCCTLDSCRGFKVSMYNASSEAGRMCCRASCGCKDCAFIHLQGQVHHCWCPTTIQPYIVVHIRHAKRSAGATASAQAVPDAFIWAPNMVGAVFGSLQVGLCLMYPVTKEYK